MDTEALLEALQSAVDEVGEIKSVPSDLVNNLQWYCDRLYSCWETQWVSSEDMEKVEDENKLLRELLRERLTFQDVIDIRLKYGLEVD